MLFRSPTTGESSQVNHNAYKVLVELFDMAQAKTISPLVLIDIAKKILESPVLKSKQPNAEIVIVFSDNDKKCCDDLTVHLQKLSVPKQIKIIGPSCESFDSVKAKAIEAFDSIKAPKFFFLDPFTYSDVGIDDVKGFMDVPAAEVLLFLPTFLSYRFKSCASKHPKLKYFLDKFTDKGHEDVADISEFNEAIREGDVIYHLVDVGDKKVVTKEKKAEILATNSFGTALLAWLIDRSNTNPNIIYASSQRIYNIEKREDVSIWIDNIMQDFKKPLMLQIL